MVDLFVDDIIFCISYILPDGWTDQTFVFHIWWYLRISLCFKHPDRFCTCS